MMRRWPHLILFIVLLLGCSTTPATPPTPPAETDALVGRLSFFGSTAMQPLVEHLGDAYSERHPGVELDIVAGGSGVGIDAVEKGEADIAMVSYDWQPDDPINELQHHQIATDALVIITHASNPVENLTSKELQDIFIGRIENWQHVGGADMEIQPVIGDATLGSRIAFDTLAMEGQANTSKATIQMTAGEMLHHVATTSNAIGYVGFGHMHQDDVKVLQIDGIMPTPTTVRDGRYALHRPLLLLTGPLSRDLAATFIAFALSAEGQQLVAERGWVAVVQQPGQ